MHAVSFLKHFLLTFIYQTFGLMTKGKHVQSISHSTFVFFILYSSFFILHSSFFILYSLFFILYSLFFILYSLFFILYSLFFILYSLFFILYSLFFILYSLFFSALYTLSVFSTSSRFSIWAEKGSLIHAWMCFKYPSVFMFAKSFYLFVHLSKCRKTSYPLIPDFISVRNVDIWTHQTRIPPIVVTCTERDCKERQLSSAWEIDHLLWHLWHIFTLQTLI